MPNIACSISVIETRTLIIAIKKIKLVFGLRSKLKNGPIIINIRPNVDERKNLGNLNILSQKSGIVLTCTY